MHFLITPLSLAPPTPPTWTFLTVLGTHSSIEGQVRTVREGVRPTKVLWQSNAGCPASRTPTVSTSYARQLLKTPICHVGLLATHTKSGLSPTSQEHLKLIILSDPSLELATGSFWAGDHLCALEPCPPPTEPGWPPGMLPLAGVSYSCEDY